MLLSIIIPCYNEGESIKYTYQEIKKVLNNINILNIQSFKVHYMHEL